MDDHDTPPRADDPIGIAALGIRNARIEGQRMRFSDAYARIMATDAVRLLEEAGYRVVRDPDAPRIAPPAATLRA